MIFGRFEEHGAAAPRKLEPRELPLGDRRRAEVRKRLELLVEGQEHARVELLVERLPTLVRLKPQRMLVSMPVVQKSMHALICQLMPMVITSSLASLENLASLANPANLANDFRSFLYLEI